MPLSLQLTMDTKSTRPALHSEIVKKSLANKAKEKTTPTYWDQYCSEEPWALECRVYDI